MKVSIIIPVFNAGVFLTEALNSIFENACHDVEFEILAIDDCSTDPHTLYLLSQLECRSNVRVLRHEKNGGPAKARNTGIRAATGDWIAFLDADDLLAPGAMELRRYAIAKHPQIQWLAGDMLEMRRPGELTHFKSFAVGANDGNQVLPGIFEIKRPTQKLVTWNMLPVMGSMMLRRDLVKKIGLFDETLIYGEDIHFCLIASCYADLYWVEKPCLYLRRYHASMTKDLLRLARESPRYTRRLLREPRLRAVHKQLRWQHAASLRQLSKVSLIHNYRFRAFQAAILAILWTPNDMKSFQSLFRACFAKSGIKF
jgi:glycosyltransferase involved in cell wall biosynthesis